MKTYAAAGLLLAFASSSHAIVATTSHDTPNGEDLTYGLIGKVNNLGAVPIGAHTVLTARHVGAGDFTLNGVVYHMTSSFNAPQQLNPDTNAMSNVDLLLINVNETLPGWYQMGTSISDGSGLSMSGWGGTGVVDADNTHYDQWGHSGTLRKGDNTLDFHAFVDTIGPSLISYLDGAGEASLMGGDSGGGFFVGGKLVGINSFIFNETVPSTPDNAPPTYPDYGFPNANTAGFTDPANGFHIDAGVHYFGSGAVDITDPAIQEFIHAKAVPEPSAWIGLGLGAGLLIRRKRK